MFYISILITTREFYNQNVAQSPNREWLIIDKLSQKIGTYGLSLFTRSLLL